MKLTPDQQAMLAGDRGAAKQMAMRLLVDLGTAAEAPRLVPVVAAHVSGVSPLTGGHGLITFLERLGDDARVVVETTLNSAGCDSRCWREMGATADYVARQKRILDAYAQLGVQLTLSCTPYEATAAPLPDGVGAWAESNAVCYANSYTGLRTNRDSGLSALAAAICGCTPDYGLLRDEHRAANLLVEVECELAEPVDFSVLGDWVGKQLSPGLTLPWGPVPHFRGVGTASHESRKALSAAAANYGCALLYLDEPPAADYQATLRFTAAELAARYAELAPRHRVDLVVIGCPQASPGEVRVAAELVRGRTLPAGRLWVFTAARHWDALRDEVAVIEAAGGMVLRDTCPEVVHYDRACVNHILTNSLKAEHYLQSGLNNMPTSVAPLGQGTASGRAFAGRQRHRVAGRMGDRGRSTRHRRAAHIPRLRQSPHRRGRRAGAPTRRAKHCWPGAGLPARQRLERRALRAARLALPRPRPASGREYRARPADAPRLLAARRAVRALIRRRSLSRAQQRRPCAAGIARRRRGAGSARARAQGLIPPRLGPAHGADDARRERA